MNDMKVVTVICMAVFGVAFVYWFITSRKIKLKESWQYNVTMRRKYHNRYVFFYNNFLTRKEFRLIVEAYATYDCFTDVELEETAVTIFTRSVGLSIVFPLIAAVGLQDITFALLAVLLSLVYYTEAVHKQVDKIYKTITEDLSTCVQSIREKYLELDNIPNAVLYCDKGAYLEKSIQRIYDMLTSANGEEILQDILRSTPIKKVKTLALICFIKNEYGDDKVSGKGSSFSEDLITLRREVDSEVRHLKKTKLAFKTVSKLVLIALAIPPIAEAYLLNRIPGTSTLLKGDYGMIVNSVIIIAVTVIYYIISTIQRPTVVNQVDTVPFLIRLSKSRRLEKVLKAVIPKKRKIRLRLKHIMDDSITSKTLEYIYTSKLIFSTCIGVAVLVFLSLFTVTNRAALVHNYNSLKFVASSDYTERQMVWIRQLDQEYMAMKERPTEEETYNLVKGKIRGINSLQIQDQTTRLMDKYDKLKAMTFKWWYVLVAFVAGAAGWFIPEAMLHLRKKMVSFEAEEDVMQLQTLMIVLANTNMSVFQSLYWMSKQSGIHKAPIRFAYHEYVSDPEGALYRLKNSVTSVELKRLVSKLESAAYKVSLWEAFSDMMLNKEQTLSLMEMVQQESLEHKKSWAKTLSSVPVFLGIFGCFALPVLILGFMEITGSLSGVHGLI